jgi:hypothetical protein
MFTLPADEDYARSILSILCARHLRPGETLSVTATNQDFLAKNMGRPIDFHVAVAYCADQEWVKLQNGMIRLTALGFEEF